MSAIRIVEGDLRIGDLRIALVASRFNEPVVERLVQGAVDALVHHGADRAGLELVRVPGAFDLPPVVRRLAESGRYDAVVALGAVIRGETDHYEHIARAAAAGLQAVSRETGIPVGFGVLTVEDERQALARSGPGAANKGAEAARAAVATVHALRGLSAKRPPRRGRRR